MESFRLTWWMMSELRIETATSIDGYLIKDLLRACQLPYEDIQDAHLVDFSLARKGGGMIGVIGLEPYDSVGLLRSLAVAEDHRYQGLGAALVANIEAKALSHGIKALYLLTTTAEGYFTKLGYQVIDRISAPESVQGTTEFRQLCPESAVCMQKRIKYDGRPNPC
jgi:amino-acid N-acetyltransferase